MNEESISARTNRGRGPGPGGRRSRRDTSRLTHYLLILAISLILIANPVSAGENSSVSVQPSGTGPQVVHVSVYVTDFNRFDVQAGTVGVDYYVTLASDSPVSIDDIELVNGMVTSITPGVATPTEKEYRVVAVLTVEPDLSRYPFDRDTLPIKMEPRLKPVQEMVLAPGPAATGINKEAQLLGWKFTGTGSSVANSSYFADEPTYSRAEFDYGISRDITSTILKFFLPIMLIVIVSLSSLMMKISSRLGLNASMFLAAVLIHWRIADGIPSVGYATFLDLFMIITYATLVMVLLSGILIMKFTESKDTARVEQIYFWSVRVIPPLTVTLYFLLFLTLAF
jgi:hypothetical protein